uniref:RRM domain-containing protein n=1 Tax=Globisporangium ultimum (strain ATCC 200006 / CBS 805.95 / DAOM BR144) TaxID=431595 RepID=K3X9A2_GLOUD
MAASMSSPSGSSSSGFSSDEDDDAFTTYTDVQGSSAYAGASAPPVIHVDVVEEDDDNEIVESNTEGEAPVAPPSALRVEEETGNAASKDVDFDALSHVVAACCMEAATPLLQGELVYDYERFTAAIYHITSHWPIQEQDENADNDAEDAKVAAYKRLRAALYARFRHAFPLTPEMYAEWLGDVEEDDLATKQHIFELSAQDYHSVPLTLQFAQCWYDQDEGDGVNKDETLVKKLLRLAGMHFTQGHEVWAYERERLSHKYDASPLLKEQRLRALYLEQMKLPLQQNDLVMSEFRAWNNYNTLEPDASHREASFEAAVKRQTKAFASLIKKMNQFEARLEAAQSGVRTEESGENDSPEHIWLQYINFVTYRVVPRLDQDEENEDEDDQGENKGEWLLKSVYERAVAMVCLSASLWSKYAMYLKTSASASDADRLALYHRAVRNVSFDSTMWNDLLLEMELQGISFDFIRGFFGKQVLSRTQPLMMDQFHFLSVLMTYCDIHRRHAVQQNYDHASVDFLENAFSSAATFISTNFPDFRAGHTQILEYHAKCVLSASSSMDKSSKATKWNALWTQIVDMRCQEAEIWLRWYQECMRTGLKSIDEIRVSVFQRAMQNVADYPASVLETWLVFERENGSLQQFLHVRQLHAELGAKASSPYEQTTSAEPESKPAAQPESKKRKIHDGKAKKEPKEAVKRVKREHAPSTTQQQAPQSTTKANKKQDPAEKKQFHERLTNEHTLFVSNLSKDVTQEELEVLFQDIPSLKDVRLVVKSRANHVKSRGMAYVQFHDDAGCVAGLEKDGHEMKGQSMHVERSKPPVAVSTDAAAKGKANDSLARDGSWKANPVTLYVGGLYKNQESKSEHIDEAALQTGIQQALQAAGELVVVTRVNILKDKRGKPKDYGLVELGAHDQVAKCVAHVQEIQKVLGDQITLKPSRFSIDQILLQQQNQVYKKKDSSVPSSGTKRGEKGSSSGAPPQAKPKMTSTLGLMPRTLRKKHLAVSEAATTAPVATKSAALTASSSSVAGDGQQQQQKASDTNAPKTNDDFRRLLLQGKQ